MIKNELNNFMLTNDNNYYVEYKEIGYILQGNLLKRYCNQLGTYKDIPVTNDIKKYIIEKCLADLPF